MEEMTLWVVGKYLGATEDGIAWELQGVFSTEQQAVSACRTETYFVGPVRADKAFPDETTEWEGAYYPFLRTTKSDAKET